MLFYPRRGNGDVVVGWDVQRGRVGRRHAGPEQNTRHSARRRHAGHNVSREGMIGIKFDRAIAPASPVCHDGHATCTRVGCSGGRDWIHVTCRPDYHGTERCRQQKTKLKSKKAPACGRPPFQTAGGRAGLRVATRGGTSGRRCCSLQCPLQCHCHCHCICRLQCP
ncbi:hypothetical protein EJ04DRAFT_151630 [Polyplosphaeria fusca]|uniref:Uncharacterized protein n=1 Tax=Polyplosphaeria fusca TaxID=682080 RepID=A0A9P4UWF1_9PLEO|nr:hypothetical protein EJ04DRAFT_151630 [Polyplosphaeria fusca]